MIARQIYSEKSRAAVYKWKNQRVCLDKGNECFLRSDTPSWGAKFSAIEVSQYISHILNCQQTFCQLHVRYLIALSASSSNCFPTLILDSATDPVRMGEILLSLLSWLLLSESKSSLAMASRSLLEFRDSGSYSGGKAFWGVPLIAILVNELSPGVGDRKGRGTICRLRRPVACTFWYLGVYGQTDETNENCNWSFANSYSRGWNMGNQIFKLYKQLTSIGSSTDWRNAMAKNLKRCQW